LDRIGKNRQRCLDALQFGTHNGLYRLSKRLHIKRLRSLLLHGLLCSDDLELSMYHVLDDLPERVQIDSSGLRLCRRLLLLRLLLGLGRKLFFLAAYRF